MCNDEAVKKMLDYCAKIQAYSAGMDERRFYESSMVVEACVFGLIQLGELAAKLDAEFMDENPQIPWKKIRGFRHRIVHDYDNINLKTVWEVITQNVPDLIGKLNSLLQGETQ